MTDIFNVIRKGTNFKNSKYKNEIQILQKSKQKSLILTNQTQNSIAQSIDFFGDQSVKVEEVVDIPKVVRIRKEKKVVVENEALCEEEVESFRKEMRIHVKGSDIPIPMTSFSQMVVEDRSIKTLLLKNIEKSNYTEPTPIQMQSIPVLLQGTDCISIAPTGSGKTATYSIPLIARLKNPKVGGIRALVLAPTRELATQILRDLTSFSAGKKFRLCLLSKAVTNGTKLQNEDKIDILISTPLRLVYLIKNNQISLNKLEYLVLDEADKLFEMGFVEQIDDILAAITPSKVTKSIFSATLPSGVEEMANTVLYNPIRIVVGELNAGASTIEQQLLFVGKEYGKIIAMRNLFHEGYTPPVLIFVQSKERAQELYNELIYDGMKIDVIHSDRTKAQRDKAIEQFRLGVTWILICTDLMARGIDFKGVNMVINYDFPQSAISYIHRIGRTGRAGRKGKALTFFTEEDMIFLRNIANVMKLSGCDVPDWMLKIKKAKLREKHAIRRNPITTKTKVDFMKSKRKQQFRKNQNPKIIASKRKLSEDNPTPTPKHIKTH